MKLRILILCSLLAACVQKHKTDPKTLVIGIESEIKSLDFRSAVDANTAHVMTVFAQGLVKLDDDLKLEPDLALNFKSEKARIFSFELPTDRKFQDGRPITCEDVRACFIQASQANSRIRSNFVDVESFECPRPNLFVIKLKAPRASFLTADATVPRILPKDLINAPDFSAGLVASGPYRFKGREGRDLIFERFDGYKFRPFFDRVVVRTIEDPTTRYLSLVGGDVDILFNALSAKRVIEASGRKDLVVFRAPGNNYQYLGFNLRLKKFQDLRVRKAMALAIDRDKIIQHKLQGLATPATSVLSPSNPYRNNEIKPWPYDPALARKLLKEAGAEHLEVELKCSSDRDVLSNLLVIKEFWEQVGIRVQLKPYEFGTFFSDVQKGNFEMYSLRWTAVTDPDILNKIFHSREVPPGRNRIYYTNHEVDRLLDIALREPSDERRRQLYDRVQKIANDEIPYIPLWYPDNIVVATNQIRGFKMNPAGSWMPFLKAHKE